GGGDQQQGERSREGKFPGGSLVPNRKKSGENDADPEQAQSGSRPTENGDDESSHDGCSGPQQTPAAEHQREGRIDHEIRAQGEEIRMTEISARPRNSMGGLPSDVRGLEHQ